MYAPGIQADWRSMEEEKFFVVRKVIWTVIAYADSIVEKYITVTYQRLIT